MTERICQQPAAAALRPTCRWRAPTLICLPSHSCPPAPQTDGERCWRQSFLCVKQTQQTSPSLILCLWWKATSSRELNQQSFLDSCTSAWLHWTASCSLSSEMTDQLRYYVGSLPRDSYSSRAYIRLCHVHNFLLHTRQLTTSFREGGAFCRGRQLTPAVSCWHWSSRVDSKEADRRRGYINSSTYWLVFTA